MMAQGSPMFRSYVANLNRVRLLELFDDMQLGRVESALESRLRTAAVLRNRPLMTRVAELKGY